MINKTLWFFIFKDFFHIENMKENKIYLIEEREKKKQLLSIYMTIISIYKYSHLT